MEPPSTPASPFHPGQPGPLGTGGGPSRTRPLLIGCGAVLVLLGIAAVVLVVKMPDLVEWVFHRLEQQVLAQLPPDVTPEERARLDRAFDAAAEAIGTNKADPNKAQALNTQLLEYGRPGRRLTRQDVLELITALEETAGIRPASPGAPPSP